MNNQDFVCKEETEWFHCDSCKSTSLCYPECHSKYNHSPTDELDNCEFKMGETTDQDDARKEEYTYKYEFKTNLASDTHGSDAQQKMANHIEIKPDLALNLNNSDAQRDHYIDNCDSFMNSISDSVKNDTQYGQTDSDFKCDTLQNSTENIIEHEKCINHSIIETDQQQQPYVTLNFNENFIQQECRDPSLDELFYCDLCEFTSSNRWCLECHSKYTHTVTDDDNLLWYQCRYCSHKTKLRSSLVSHFQTQHDTNPVWYQCYHCGFKMKNKHWLAKHIKSLHKTACLRCKFCNFRTTKESSLKTHVEQHKLSACPVCGYRTTKKGNLYRHLNLNHNESTKWYQCQFCHFKTKHEQSLRRHVERKHDQDLACEEKIQWFLCDSCEFKSTNPWYLEFHSNHTHNLSDEVDQSEFKITDV